MTSSTDKALVFNVERASCEDGPGIRTVVFLKGCALRCKWCANPESQSFERQIIVNTNICKNCGKCLEICPQNAISKLKEQAFITSDAKCSGCLECVNRCYADARSLAGTEYTSEQLVTELLKDEKYFHMSDGGVTFSGGEPLYYTDFLCSCIRQLKEHRITTLIETCGYVPLSNIEKIAGYADYIFYDIKHMDEKKHIEYTGASNKLIINNLIYLNDHFKGELSVRCPVIPGVNDSKEEIESLLTFVSSLHNVKEMWFLPYHRLGLPKYEGLGREYPMGNLTPLKLKDIEYLKDYGNQFDIRIKI